MRHGDPRWLKRFGRGTPAEVQLLCFHHAGGSAAMYRHWPQLVPSYVEPIAVQLPGRADRFAEPPFDRMAPLVDELIAVIKPLLDRPFACYGVSMGARVAWALAHELRERALPLPRVLFVAASIAPCLDDGTWAWEDREDGLEGYVREMGGTPAEVLAEPELLAGLLPTLGADLTVLSTHGFHPDKPLEVPIRAFAGTEDIESPPPRMDGWRVETAARFDLDPVPGGHFFDSAGEQQVIRTISHDLA
ncbi:thioesterase domain-containing protein [Nonomuraea sp. NPDC003709]|uniref:thioesterase II family protein n=1 Tax=unclassified Nonomuraea TaxID=2593643 RepID=UPI0033AC6629